MKLLAFDTSTEALSVAVWRDDGAAASPWQYSGAGGAQASADLIAQVLALLQQAGLGLAELDAICFGCGPGSFTGLRTACAVAQGLAFGAGVPVLPVGSLLAVAEAARLQQAQPEAARQVTALLDARMDELYLARYAYADGVWTELQAAVLVRPEDARTPADAGPSDLVAGNVFATYGARLDGLAPGLARVAALPQATAMLRLAPALLAQGRAVAPAQALPLYVRDKVAQTTAERAAARNPVAPA